VNSNESSPLVLPSATGKSPSLQDLRNKDSCSKKREVGTLEIFLSNKTVNKEQWHIPEELQELVHSPKL
jgi:hypothetical protein